MTNPGNLSETFQSFLFNLKFNLAARNNPIYQTYLKHLYRPNQFGLSGFLDLFSRTKKGEVTLVQIGANDGFTRDPIHKFVKRDHWSGVLLEPQKAIHEQFLTPLYDKEEEVKTVCMAIGPKDGEAEHYRIAFSEERWATRLSTFNKEELLQDFESGLVKRMCRRFNIPMPEDAKDWILTEKIQVISPSTLVAKFNLSTIDLLQIDTKGYDYQVIKLFDEASLHPEAIIFENKHLSQQDNTQCLRLLHTRHYQTREYGSNTLALRNTNPLFNEFIDPD